MDIKLHIPDEFDQQPIKLIMVPLIAALHFEGYPDFAIEDTSLIATAINDLLEKNKWEISEYKHLVRIQLTEAVIVP